MSPRSLRPCLVAGLTSLAVCGLAPLALGQEPPPAPAAPAAPSVPPADNELYGPIKLPAAPLEMMLQALEDLTGRTVLRPPALPPGEYNLVINRKMPKAEAIMAFETVLAMNQIGIAPLGDKFLKVVPLMNVRTEAPEMITGSSLDLAPSGRIASKVFSLDFLRVTEFMPQIVNMLNPQLGGPVIFDKTNAFMLTDSVSNLQRIERLLLELDKPITANLTPKFYPLTSAKASDVVNKLRSIFQGAIQQQLGSATSFSPDDRTNQVILIADARQHPFFDDLIRKLDVKADPNTRNEVIYLKHAASKDVAALLSQLISGQTSAASKTGGTSVRPGQLVQPGQPPAPAPAAGPEGANAAGPIASSGTLGGGTTEFSNLITVIADERSNAVVVSGTVDDVRLIRELVDKIDIILAQVRIEVVITEVTLSDTDVSGISALNLQFGKAPNGGTSIIGYSGTVAGVGVGGATAAGTDGGTVLSGLGTVNPLAFVASLQNTGGKSNVKILSAPTIVTTHNKDASIQVTQQTPIISSIVSAPTTTVGNESSSFNQSQSVSYKDIGITLKVTPLIGDDGNIQLKVDQIVDDIIETTTVNGNSQPIIGHRQATSFVNVKDGNLVVLGGLQRATDRNDRAKLGFIWEIPGISQLFGGRNKAQNRTELLLFIRPHVIRPEDASTDTASAINRLSNRDQINNYLTPPAPKTDEKAKSTPPASLRRPK